MQPQKICPQCYHPVRSAARYCSQCGAAIWQPVLREITLRERYRIDQLIGKGGFGEAYKAYDLQLKRYCLVKRLVVDPSLAPEKQQLLRQNFQREAELLVALNAPGHPNIPEIF